MRYRVGAGAAARLMAATAYPGLGFDAGEPVKRRLAAGRLAGNKSGYFGRYKYRCFM
jgi:hypothetical protein